MKIGRVVAIQSCDNVGGWGGDQVASYWGWPVTG